MGLVDGRHYHHLLLVIFVEYIIVKTITTKAMHKQTAADPTGQSSNRNKGTRRLSARLTKIEREVKALFRAIPKKARTKAPIQNAEATIVYDWSLPLFCR